MALDEFVVSQAKSRGATRLPTFLITREYVSLDERGDLDLIMLEPDRLLQMRSFEFDVVETKRLVDVGMGDGIDGSDGSL